mgnify:CR=1 FL=1
MSKRDDAIYRAALVRQEAGDLGAIASGYEAGLADAEAEVARLRALLRRLREEIAMTAAGIYILRGQANVQILLADTDEALKDAEGSAAEHG